MVDWWHQLQQVKSELLSLLGQLHALEEEYRQSGGESGEEHLPLGPPLVTPVRAYGGPFPDGLRHTVDAEAEEILTEGFELVEEAEPRRHILRPSLFLSERGISLGPCELCGKRWVNVEMVPFEECPGRPPVD